MERGEEELCLHPTECTALITEQPQKEKKEEKKKKAEKNGCHNPDVTILNKMFTG